MPDKSRRFAILRIRQHRSDAALTGTTPRSLLLTCQWAPRPYAFAGSLWEKQNIPESGLLVLGCCSIHTAKPLVAPVLSFSVRTAPLGWGVGIGTRLRAFLRWFAATTPGPGSVDPQVLAAVRAMLYEKHARGCLPHRRCSAPRSVRAGFFDPVFSGEFARSWRGARPVASPTSTNFLSARPAPASAH